MPSRQPVAEVKLALSAGDASIPELGKMLGPHGVPIAAVKREYDAATVVQRGHTVPVVVTVFEDRSWALRIKTPTTSSLIRAELNGHRRLSRAQLRAIAERKLPDLNTPDGSAMRTAARARGREPRPPWI